MNITIAGQFDASAQVRHTLTMQKQSIVKRRRSTDINQLAKSIVDLATGNPIMEDLPVESKRVPIVDTRESESKGNKSRPKKLSIKKQKDVAEKSQTDSI